MSINVEPFLATCHIDGDTNHTRCRCSSVAYGEERNFFHSCCMLVGFRHDLMANGWKVGYDPRWLPFAFNDSHLIFFKSKLSCLPFLFNEVPRKKVKWQLPHDFLCSLSPHTWNPSSLSFS